MISKQDIIYISGPMSGYENLNIPLFKQVTKDLREKGYIVVNPADYTVSDATWEDYIRLDLSLMLDKCTVVCVLPNWWESKGAVVEVALASRIGMKIYDAFTLEELNIGWEITAFLDRG